MGGVCRWRGTQSGCKNKKVRCLAVQVSDYPFQVREYFVGVPAFVAQVPHFSVKCSIDAIELSIDATRLSIDATGSGIDSVESGIDSVGLVICTGESGMEAIKWVSHWSKLCSKACKCHTYISKSGMEAPNPGIETVGVRIYSLKCYSKPTAPSAKSNE